MLSRRRIARQGFLIAILAVWVLSAVAMGSSATTFRIAIDSDARGLDPAKTQSGTWDGVLAYVAEPLLTIDQRGALVPDLATSWERSADGATETFHLRQGVTFQDGTPFDAKAAKWNLERVMDPSVHSLISVAFSDVSSIEAVDRYTLRLHLKLPALDPTPALSTMFTAMISPASVGEHGNTYQEIRWPVGTGPYRFVSYRKETDVRVARNDQYWGEAPYYPQVEFQIVPDPATRESMLLAGQTDMIVSPSLSELGTLRKDPRVSVLSAPGDLSYFVGLNTSKPPLDDARVRQALNYAVNKQAIIHGIMHDAVIPADSVVAPSVLGYVKLDPFTYDPAKARALLAQAGVKPGSLTLHIIIPTNHGIDAMTIAQAIAGQLEDVGIHLVVEPLSFPAYVASIFKPKAESDTELFLSAISPPDLTALPILLGFRCDWLPPQGQNFEFYCNKSFDQALASASTAPTRQLQAAGYQRAIRIVWRDAPRIWLFVGEAPVAYSSDVTGISVLPNQEFRAEYAHPVR